MKCDNCGHKKSDHYDSSDLGFESDYCDIAGCDCNGFVEGEK